MHENEIGQRRFSGVRLRYIARLGPGLLESVYEACLAHELRKVGLTTNGS